jgi:Ca-activated chloride channel family protein
VRVPVGHASVMLVLDHSGSMQATDVKPTRLAAAQSAARAFVAELPSQVRVGAVAFSTVANGVQAPTANRRAALEVLDAQTAVGSTATGNALTLALDLLEAGNGVGSAASSGTVTSPGGSAASSPDGTTGTDPPHTKRTPSAIVLLSDGAANAGRDPVEVAAEAGARRIPIYTVALGNADATIPNPEGDGPPIAVPPDPELLARIAEASHGRAFTAQDSDRLISIYRSLGAQLGTVARSRDLTVAFALVGGMLLVVAGLLALRGGRLP